jgi:hypothetical protein
LTPGNRKAVGWVPRLKYQAGRYSAGANVNITGLNIEKLKRAVNAHIGKNPVGLKNWNLQQRRNLTKNIIQAIADGQRGRLSNTLWAPRKL